MRIMQSFRQNMPVVVIGLIVTFIILMVLGDILSPGGGLPRAIGGAAAGEVNGQEISSAYYLSRVNEVIQAQREANPDGEIDEEQIREGIWQALVDETLIQQTADRLGIFVSDKELADVLFYDPPAPLKQQFTDSNGVFMQDIYFRFLRDIDGYMAERQVPQQEITRIKASITKFQEDLRRQRLHDAVQSVVTAPAMPSPAEARTAFDDQRAKASGSYVMIDASQIPDSTVGVSDEEARQYYDANKTQFQQKASREVRYVVFPLTPSAQDSSSVTRRLRTVNEGLQQVPTLAAKDSLFQGYVDQYGSGRYNGSEYTPLQDLSPELQSALQGATPGAIIGPVRMSEGTFLINVADVKDSGETFVKAQHILLRTTGTNDDSVQAQAESLLKRAQSGENFDELARQYSADPGSGQRGGDLGFFRRGSMVKPFEDAAFAASVGSIVGPVKTDYGYHIIKVTDRSMKSYKLRDLRFDPHISNITKNNLRSRARQFREMVANGTPIDTAAAKQNLQVLETGPIMRTQPAGGSMRLTSFAYSGSVGDVSDVIDVPNGGLIVGQLSKVSTPGVMDFTDAKETIIGRLRTQKKLDMLKSKATSLRGQLAQGDSLTKLSTSDPGVQVRSFSDLSRTSPFPGVGFDYALTNAVFNQPLNQPSQPIRGERGYYIVLVDHRSQPTDQEFESERTKFIQQLTAQRRQAMFQDWLQKARERAAIEDYRHASNL